MAYCGDFGAMSACAPAATCAPGFVDHCAPAFAPAPVAHTAVEAWGRPVWRKNWLFGKWKYAGLKDVQYVPRSHLVAPTPVPAVIPTASVCAPAPVCAPAFDAHCATPAFDAHCAPAYDAHCATGFDAHCATPAFGAGACATGAFGAGYAAGTCAPGFY